MFWCAVPYAEEPSLFALLVGRLFFQPLCLVCECSVRVAVIWMLQSIVLRAEHPSVPTQNSVLFTSLLQAEARNDL